MSLLLSGLLLAYRTGALVWDVGVLILLVILQVLHLYSGESHILGMMIPKRASNMNVQPHQRGALDHASFCIKYIYSSFIVIYYCYL